MNTLSNVGISNDMREPMICDEPVISETCYITSHWLLCIFNINPGGMCCDVTANEHDWKRDLQQKIVIVKPVFLTQSLEEQMAHKLHGLIFAGVLFIVFFWLLAPGCHYRNKLSEYSRVYLTGFPSTVIPVLSLSWVAQAFKAGLVRVQIGGEGRFSTPVSTGHSPCRSSASESLDEGGMERARGEPQAWLCSPAQLGSPDPVLASFLSILLLKPHLSLSSIKS